MFSGLLVMEAIVMTDERAYEQNLLIGMPKSHFTRYYICQNICHYINNNPKHLTVNGL